MTEIPFETKKTMLVEKEKEKDSGNFVRNTVVAISSALTLVTLFLVGQMDNRLNTLASKLDSTSTTLDQKISANATETSNAKEVNAMLTDELSKQSVQTQKVIASRTAQLRKEQTAALKNISDQQKQQQEALDGVKTDVGGMITDMGGVKTDVSTVKTDLEDTKSKLNSAVGDINGHSTLIASTRDELEVLKHKGDRNYYEFTLIKNKIPEVVSTVKLLLKKTDPKKNQFTLVINADDKAIEKKDRGAGELLQFVTGRNRMLYELVVYNVDKNKVEGYLSTPKNAPTPVTASDSSSMQQ